MKKLTSKSLEILKLPLLAVGAIGLLYCVTSCKSSPYQSKAVTGFNSDKYLGEWYEVARFDFKYEKDLKNVTANYSKREDGKIKVLNKGFNYIENEWQEKEGKAKFVDGANKGALKVSFFGPFYAEYNVVMVDENYQTALVFGESTKYMWILSRTKTISNETKEKYVSYAKENGFPIENLVWTQQD